MDKLKMHSMNKVDANVAQIAALFPNCVTERINEEGKLEKVVDFDMLKQELSSFVVEGNEERYQFTWPDKKKTIRSSNAPINKTLRPCRCESVNFDATQNLYIEGDNFEVLKLLQETYLGKIKLIYIDPPYNTGHDFVYEDDFTQDVSTYIENSGQIDALGNRLVQNAESNGRFHTDWLNMIYPRVKLAKDLLTEDGVIFISIDDNEIDNLRKICDEIFGESNFIGQLILKTATDNNPSQINIEHEYMICYAKNKLTQKNWVRRSEAASKIVGKYNQLRASLQDNDEIQKQLRVWIKEHKDELPQVAHYNNVDDKGVYSSSSNSSNPHPGGYMFDIIHPVTGQPCPKPQNGWRWPEKTFLAYAADGEVEWGKDHTTQPHIKKRIETSVEYLRTLIYEDNRATTKMLSDLFDGHKVFDNPKPVNVLMRIMEFVLDENSTVLDFFSGSATTAHSVMQLNANIGSNHKFIMVQLPELTPEKSEAYKVGFKNICEIGKERIRRAGAKIKADSPMTTQDLDIGFRVLKCDSSNMKEVYYNPAELEISLLTDLTDNIKEDRTAEDLLFQVMLDLGIMLSAKVEQTTLDGKTVFNVNGNHLIACFDKEITDETIKAIAKQEPYYFVMRDDGFANDSVATNFEQIFATYSPDTVRKVL